MLCSLTPWEPALTSVGSQRGLNAKHAGPSPYTPNIAYHRHSGQAANFAMDATGPWCLRRRSESWQIEGIFGRSNFRASDALRDQVNAYLRQHGIEEPQRGRPKSAWDAVRRAASSPSFDFDLK